MPLDPLIANPAKLELPNPLADSQMFLQNSLAMRQIDDANRKRKRGQLLDNAFASSRGADGTLDNSMLDKYLLDNGLGEELATIQQQRADLAYKTKQGQHIDSQILGEGAKTKQTEMATNHERLKAKGTWLTNTKTGFEGVQNPEQAKLVIDTAADEATNAGVFTPEGATKWRDLQLRLLDDSVKTGSFTKFLEDHRLGAEKAAEKVFTTLNGKDTNQVIASPKFASAPSTSVASVAAPERKGITVNNNMGGNKYRDKFEELQAESDFSGQQQAKEAQNIVAGIKEAHSLVDRAYTGMGAGFKQGANQVANMFGVNDPAGDDARVATQQLNSYLATAMLKNIAALRNEGVKLGSVTEKEFAELQKTTPNGSSDPATIHAWLNKMEASMNRAIEEHRAQLKRASVAPSTGRTISNMGVQPVVVDGNKGGSVDVIVGQNGTPVPAKAIDILRAQPGTRALFEKRFGKAAADQVLGGGPTGQVPFAR